MGAEATDDAELFFFFLQGLLEGDAGGNEVGKARATPKEASKRSLAEPATLGDSILMGLSSSTVNKGASDFFFFGMLVLVLWLLPFFLSLSPDLEDVLVVEPRRLDLLDEGDLHLLLLLKFLCFPLS